MEPLENLTKECFVGVWLGFSFFISAVIATVMTFWEDWRRPTREKVEKSPYYPYMYWLYMGNIQRVAEPVEPKKEEKQKVEVIEEQPDWEEMRRRNRETVRKRWPIPPTPGNGLPLHASLPPGFEHYKSKDLHAIASIFFRASSEADRFIDLARVLGNQEREEVSRKPKSKTAQLISTKMYMEAARDITNRVKLLEEASQASPNEDPLKILAKLIEKYNQK